MDETQITVTNTDAPTESAHATQSADAPANETDAPMRRDDFEALIRGEYKREFDERVQKIISKRFRETKELREHAERAKPVFEALKQAYGDIDQEALVQKLRAPQTADAPPENSEQAKTRDDNDERADARARLSLENEKLRADNHALARESRAREIVDNWRESAEAVKREYPEFSLERALDNKQFANLLRAGVDVKTAYEVVNKDALIGGAMRLTAEKIREKTVNDILTRGARPGENGASGRGASRVSPQKVSDMTRGQREEIERRSLSGELIYFDP